jgi:hypothetical protein
VAGDVICLAAGNYGTFTGTNKAITIREQDGAAATLNDLQFAAGDTGFTLDGLSIDGGRFGAGATNISIRNSAFTSHLTINGVLNGNILLDHNSYLNINAASDTPPARIHLSYGCDGVSGVTISNSLLAYGDADGIQTGCGVTILNNEFRDISQSGPNHTDNIQMVGSSGTVIRGNWIHSTTAETTQGISAYDGIDHAVIEDNVVDIRRFAGIELYSDDGSIVRHNTLVYYPAGCYGSLECGKIDINRKSADDAGRNTVVQDNVATEITVQNGSTLAKRDHNLLRQSVGSGDTLGTPTFVGGGGWAGFRLAANSAGKHAASDGLDVGIR